VKKSEIYGLVGSAISTSLLILLLFLIVLPSLKTPEDAGIMVSFGETIDGGGVTQTPTSRPSEPSSPAPSTPKPQKQDLMTQDDNSFAINEQKKKDKQAKDALDNQKKDEARIAAEKKRIAQKSDNLVSGSIGKGGNTGSGNTSGNTNQGNPAGKGSSGGNSWSLEGRDLESTLVKPTYKEDTEGQITIEIRVDKNGNVVGNPKIVPISNISERSLIEATIAVARNAKFSKGDKDVIGKIIYRFNLN